MEHSAYISIELHRQIRREKPKGPPSDPATWPEAWKKAYFKEYPRFEKITLPTPRPIRTAFSEVLTQRKSSRLFDSKKSLAVETFSDLLYWSAGMHSEHTDKDRLKETRDKSTTHRFYPSGGGRYPLEVYLSTKSVSGVKDALYHYRPSKHDLELLWTEQDKGVRDALLYDWSKQTQLILVITALWERNFMKYGDFGYAMVCFEAGHLMQNLTMVCASLDLDICPLAGFDSEEIARVIDLEYQEETPLYVASIGVPQKH